MNDALSLKVPLQTIAIDAVCGHVCARVRVYVRMV